MRAQSLGDERHLGSFESCSFHEDTVKAVSVMAKSRCVHSTRIEDTRSRQRCQRLGRKARGCPVETRDKLGKKTPPTKTALRHAEAKQAS